MHDVIVAGAGPAGNVAAYRLAGMGYDVAVLDWRLTPGDKLCTGIVGTECLERYPADDADIFKGARSASVVAPSGKSHRIVKDTPQAYIIDRVAYVSSLARRAAEAGADYSLGENIVGIERSSSGVTVSTTGTAGGRRHRARVIIIASGFASPLLRMVGLGDRAGAEYMRCGQAEVEPDGLEDTEVYLGSGIAPGSFGWMVPLSGSRALVGLVSRGRLNGHMAAFMSGLESNGKLTSVIEGPKRWGLPIRPVRKTFGDRVLVAGDAAGFVKPTSGGGIYYALLSGEVAADTVHSASMADDFSARQLKRYETGWKAIFERELRIGYYARLLYETLDDDQIERLLDGFLGTDLPRDFSFDWHSGLILKAICHRKLGALIKSFGPMVGPLLSRLGGLRAGNRSATAA